MIAPQHLLSSPIGSQAASQQLATQLAGGGAVLTLPGASPKHFLIGELTWLEDDRLFWFPAHGDAGDERVLAYDELHVIENHTVSVLHEGRPVCRLSSIEVSGVDDPDDYRVAWQIWQQVAPLQRKRIAALRQRHEAH